jgi:hypothetical protein
VSVGGLDAAELARELAPLNPRISVGIRQGGAEGKGKRMPYDKLSGLPDHVRKRGKTASKRWRAIFNSVFAKDGEAKAFAAANASLDDPHSGHT